MQLITARKRKKEAGLTLVEVMVSLLLLTSGLIPILGVIISSVALSTRIKNNLIAANLAQEGVEVVRAIREDHFFDRKIIYDTTFAISACISAVCNPAYS